MTAMDIRWKKIARPKLMELRDAFRADDSIIDLLFSKFLINEEDRQKLRQLTNQERVSMLITEILPSKGPQSFDRFLSALRDAEGFSHIVELLSPVPVREKRSSSSSSSGEPNVRCERLLRATLCRPCPGEFRNYLLFVSMSSLIDVI